MKTNKHLLTISNTLIDLYTDESISTYEKFSLVACIEKLILTTGLSVMAGDSMSAYLEKIVETIELANKNE